MRLTFNILILTLLSCTGLKSDPERPATSTQFRNQFLVQVNNARKSGCMCGRTYMPPVPPLIWNPLLERSAYSHAQDMHRRRYFAHTNPAGKTIKNRIEEAGYTLSGMRSYAFGENIAAGQRSIDQVMKGWLTSEGHCKNIMSSKFKELGVAEVNRYWVQDFGMRESWK